MLAILLISFWSLSAVSELTEFGATEGTCGPDLTWELCEGTLTISGFGPMDDYTSQEGMPWVVLKDTIHDVILPQGITTIGAWAFHNSDIRYVVRNNGIEKIDNYAFADCESLYGIVIPASVTEISENAFAGSNMVVIITTENSYACQYAERKALPVIVNK